MAAHPEYADDDGSAKANIHWGVVLGHVRYGTLEKNSIRKRPPILRQNNWMHRNLILAN
jgi:amidophosphoribosyltransferase